MRVRHLSHNQGDEAPAPHAGWDVASFTERSGRGLPARMDNYRPGIKGLELAWDPDVMEVTRRRKLRAHPPISRITPERGTAWVEGAMDGRRVAVVVSHRINDPDGSDRPMPPLRAALWTVHAWRDAALFRSLERRGFLVLYGGDVNHRTAKLAPLVRHLTGRYDAMATSRRVQLVGRVEAGPRGGAHAHRRFTATYEL